MFILFSISSGLEFWSVNLFLLYEISELKLCKNIKFLGEISNKWAKDLLGKNIYNTLDSCR